MLAKHTLDKAAAIGADILAPRPLKGDVTPHRLDQITGDFAESFASEHLHRAVVGLRSVVEGEFVIRQPEFLASRVHYAHVAGALDQFLHNLHGVHRAVLLAGVSAPTSRRTTERGS